MLRVLLLGGGGQVGRELAPLLRQFASVEAPTRGALPLDDLDALRRAVRQARPELIVNAAAWNDVDGAERDEAGALRVNRDAVALLGEEAAATGAALLHYSTDFVFDGDKGAPYTEEDAVAPLSAYGRSKAAGERALAELDAPAVVLRTAWVYSVGRKSFVSAILRAAREREELRVVCDQEGNPTFARDLAVATALIVRGAMRGVGGDVGGDAGRAVAGALREARGVYHAAGAGSCTRHALAEAALALDPRREEHRARSVIPVSSAAFPTPARRPRQVILDGEKLRRCFGVALPDWRDALSRALADLALYAPPRT